MIEVTPEIKKRFPEAFRIARRDKMRVVWLRDGLIYVARKAPRHGEYLVRFNVSEDLSVAVNCRHLDGKPCDGMVFRKLCAHAAAAIIRGQQRIRSRRHRRAA